MQKKNCIPIFYLRGLGCKRVNLIPAAAARPQRIGLLGGTFDPPHRGHLILAHHFSRLLQLDQIIWIPSGHSWQKEKVSPSAHRLAMTQLLADELRNLMQQEEFNGHVKSAAVLGWPYEHSESTRVCAEKNEQPLAQRDHSNRLGHVRNHVEVSVSDIEVMRPGPSYTSDTLRALRAHFGAAPPLYWLMGMDQLLHLHTWHDWQLIFDYSHICVASRPGYVCQPETDLAPTLYEKLGTVTLLQSSTHGALLLDQHLEIDLSSSILRDILKQQQIDNNVLEKWLTPSVIAYIKQHQLYSFTYPTL